MKTTSGILHLGSKERKALEIIQRHTHADISYGEGGSYNCEGKNSEYVFDKKEAEKAELGLSVIDFILQITK